MAKFKADDDVILIEQVLLYEENSVKIYHRNCIMLSNDDKDASIHISRSSNRWLH